MKVLKGKNMSSPKKKDKKPTPEQILEFEIKFNKQMRQDMDYLIQEMKKVQPSREREKAFTKMQEAVMWLGMDLKRLGTPNPYPNSKNPENTIIEPTADNLKL